MSQSTKSIILIILMLCLPTISRTQNKPASDMLLSAIQLGQRKQYSEAISIASNAFITDSLEHGMYHQYVMMDCYYLGVLNKKIQSFRKAIEYAEKSLCIHNRIYPQKDINGKIQILSIISYSNLALRNYNEAIINISEIVKLYNRINKKDLDYATALNNLAYCYARSNDYDKAISIEEEVLLIRRHLISDKSSEVYLNTLVNLGSYYLKKELYNQAIDIYKEELTLKKLYFGDSTPSIMSTLTNLAICYLETGKINEAESCCIESLHIREICSKEAHQNINTQRILSDIYSKRGDWWSSVKLGNQILKLKETSGDTLDINYATVLNNTANYYSYLGLNSQAIDLGKKVIQLKCVREESEILMKSLSNLSLYYTNINDNISALDALTQALTLARKENFDDNIFASLYLNIAGCLGDLQQDSLCNAYYELALHSSPAPDTKAAILMQQAYSENDQYDFFERKKMLENAENLIEICYGETHPYTFLYRFQKILLLNEYGSQVSQEYEDLLRKMTDWYKNNLVRMSMKEREDFYDKWMYVLLHGPSFLDNNQDIRTRVNAYNAILAYKGILLNPEKTIYTTEQVSQQLSLNECAIEFVVSNESEKYNYMALILKQNSAIPICVKIPELDHSSVGKTPTIEVCQYVWRKIFPYISKCNTVFFSCEGDLTQFPIENVLPDTIKAVRLSCTSEILNRKNKQENKEPKNFLLAGGINYRLPRKTPDEKRTRGTLCDITETTLKEVSIIGNIIKSNQLNCHIHTGFVNKRFLFDDSIQIMDVIHIATHGYFYDIDKKVKNSYISNYIKKTSTQSISFEDLALLRCGLLFSPDSKFSRQDNASNFDVLTGNEISKIHLNADLVVLSACETGNGISFSEGVYGLQRAFKKAGAKSILMSLWKVDDEATQLFMTHFYSDYLKYGSKQHAIKSAQNYLRMYKAEDGERIYSDPYYWAGFVLLDALN